MKAVVFDFGGVLLDWNPRYLFKKILRDDLQVEQFLVETRFSHWNELADSGVPFSELEKHVAKEAPQWVSVWKEFRPRFLETLSGPILDNVKLLEELSQGGVPVYGLTNWSMETFPLAFKEYSFFSCFLDIIVSGKEKLIKPDLKIFTLMLNRFQIQPAECFFVDDNENNILSARSLGIYSHHFVSPGALRSDIISWLARI